MSIPPPKKRRKIGTQLIAPNNHFFLKKIEGPNFLSDLFSLEQINRVCLEFVPNYMPVWCGL